jgi:predicted RNase H-like HicB family nuclease
MLIEYVQSAMRIARYKLLDDGTFFGEIPGFQGVWANAASLEGCREELQSTLEDWIVLGLRLNHSLPVVGGMDLNPKEAPAIQGDVA